MQHFKQGDIVVCIDAQGMAVAHPSNHLKYLQEYVVEWSGDNFVVLEGSNVEWHVTRFALKGEW